MGPDIPTKLAAAAASYYYKLPHTSMSSHVTAHVTKVLIFRKQ